MCFVLLVRFQCRNSIGSWLAEMRTRAARPLPSLSVVEFIVRPAVFPKGDWVPLSWMSFIETMKPVAGACCLITKAMIHGEFS